MKKYSELTRNTFIFGLSTAGIKIVSFILLPLYTSKINAIEMGSITILSTVIAILIPILTLGLNIGIIRFSMDKDIDDSKIYTSLLIVWFISIFVLLLMYPIFIQINSINKFISYLYIIYILNSFEVLISQYVRGKELIKIFALSGVIKTIVLGLSNVLFLAILDYSSVGYLLSIIASYICSIFYLLIFGVKIKKLFVIDFDYLVFKSIILFSLPFIPNSISWWINNASDKFLILHFLGEEATGIYSVANRIPSLLILFTIVFNQAWQITAIKKYKNTSRKYFSEVFQQYGTLLFTACSFIIFLSPFLAKILFQNEYFIAWKFVPFLLVAMVAGALANYYDALIISSKKTKNIFYATSIAAIFNITLNIILIPIVGIMGAAISTMISYIIIFLIKIYTAKRLDIYFKIHPIIFILLILVVFQTFIQTSVNNILNLYSFVVVISVLAISLRQIINIFKKLLPEI